VAAATRLVSLVTIFLGILYLSYLPLGKLLILELLLGIDFVGK
jgi:uncharacterized membrane protein HdeD (DUF308 family)